ncbi:hypothetical protein [Halodesulfovibrio spirochaetisodalis]|uniref:SPOR domain-containing protein n=1 Tax=Halodesulfovibrio spirochaetisodalis TaxID=1560234 RepID=A0A1B7XD68_9BACT|nr:hypothetical protein [Halodesulfovibrio spirochaetisodalis]OBQ51907.1 hypothetical protein SP90_08735 [Halodesulfovibrio spirochaetisodalis]
MKFIIQILLLILSTSPACAQSIISVSCDEIAKISICQARTSEPPILTTEYPYVYPTAFWFKPNAAPKFKKFTDPNKVATIYPDGTKIEYRPFILSTPAGMISSDTPYQASINSRQIHMYFKSKEKAFEAAQKVCPQIKPKVFFVYDHLEEQRLKEKTN